MADRPLILVTGGTGQVGTALREAGDDRFELVFPGRAELDLSDAASVARALDRGDYAAVVNCAAYTAVDKAESEPELAQAVNADAPRLLAEASAARGLPIVHVSTDYVFDGGKAGPYVEEDPVAPVSAYGRSKEAGEQGVRDANPRHVILRTAWVVSPWGGNFVKTMLRLGAERDALSIVDDQHGCPTSAGDIADAILTVLARLLEDEAAPTGTYHFANAGEASWFDVADAVFARSRAAGAKAPTLSRIPTSAYPTPARRPANSRLSTAKITREYGVVPRPWRVALDEVLTALGA